MRNKKLEIALFNIYDVIVFEDENGITQDCVCSIYKDEVDEIKFDVVECNGHSISIYENGSYEVWEKDRKNISYYATNKRIMHLYTLKNDNRFYEIYPTDDYDITENTNSSEALKELGYLLDEVSSLTKYVYEYSDGFESKLGSICEKIEEIKDTLQFALTTKSKQEEYIKELEDLEEELSIDLITIFKALTEGVYVLECDDEDNLYPCYKPPFFNRFLAERRIESGYKFNYYISIGADEDLLNIKDYGEVWALTEEELEYEK